MENSRKYIVKEVKLTYKAAKDLVKRPKITCSEEAYKIFIDDWDMELIDLQEQGKVLYLNSQAKVLAIYAISVGGTTGTVMDPRLIFATALKINACKIILAHNHPSGNLSPSESDLKITKKIAEAARLLDMKVHDHIIVTANGYTSLADKGLM